MKTIGMIGGMSWESSIEYYRIINETVRDKLGGLHSSKSVMYSLDFAEIEALQHQNQWGEATQLMIMAGCGFRPNLHQHHAQNGGRSSETNRYSHPPHSRCNCRGYQKKRVDNDRPFRNSFHDGRAVLQGQIGIKAWLNGDHSQ